MMHSGMCWDSQLIQAVTLPSPHKTQRCEKTESDDANTGVQMRRAIAAAVVSGLAFGGISATPAFAVERGAEKVIGTAKEQSAAHATAKTVKAKTATTAKTAKPNTRKSNAAASRWVIYHGLEAEVPAIWPVYRLDQHPSTCVRYDINAVYLGLPGANMQCPAGLIGHTATFSIIPSATAAAGSGSEITAQRVQPDGQGGTMVGSLPAVHHAAITQDASQHELRVVLGAALLGATILGTYGEDPAVIQQVFATLRVAPKGAAESAQTGSPQALLVPSRTRQPALSQSATAEILAARAAATGLQPASARTRRFGWAAARSLSAAATSTAWRGIPVNWPVQIVKWPPIGKPPPFHPVNGFDSCTPSLDTIRAWRHAFGAVGIYIGGLNMGCSFGTLSAGWVRSVAGLGWGMLPTYVGLQAPCTNAGGTSVINQGQAAAEGRQSGQEAVADARTFGFGPGSPVYYDMEGYNATDAGCVSTVLTYLSAWDRQVNAEGYLSAVYSSQDSGIADLQAATLAKTPGFVKPDGVWIALWDNVPSLGDGNLAWRLSDRVKQYAGNVWVSGGGYTLQVDQDIVGGPLAR